MHQQSTLSPEEQMAPVATQTVNQNYHPNLWYSSVGRSTDTPLLEASDYTQCLHFHALASQWQCSLHSWAVDRKMSKRYKCEGTTLRHKGTTEIYDTKEHPHPEYNIFTAY